MKILIHTIAILLAMFAAHVTAQGLKIGYVDGLRIEKESALPAREIEQRLQELQKQGLELQAEIEKEGLTMGPADKQAKEKRMAALSQQFEQLQRSVAEDLEVRKSEARARFLAETTAIIKGIAEAGKYDLIVQQAIYGSPHIDITEQVLKEMAKRAESATSPGK